MASLFGNDPGDPSILSIISATLRDAGAGYGGRQSDVLGQLMAQQRQSKIYQQLQQSVLGTPTAPGLPGVNITPNQMTGQGGGVIPPVAPGGLQGGALGGSPQSGQLAEMLSKLPPEIAAPIYMQLIGKQFEAPKTTAYKEGDVGLTQNPDGTFTQAFAIPKQKPDYTLGNQRISGDTNKPLYSGPPKAEFINGQAVDPYNVPPGTVIPQQGAPPLSAGRFAQQQQLAEIGKAPSPTAIWDDPKLVEVSDGKGGTEQITAQQNKQTGQWATADQFRTPLDPTGLRVLNQSQLPGGGRVAGQTGRITGAGELVTTALENLSQLPATSNFGLLGQAGQPATIRGALAREVTPEEAQMYQAVSKGLSRGLAALEAEGLAPSGAFTNSLEGLTIQAGNSGEVALLKLAEQRQAAESSLKAIQKGPLLTKGQQEEVASLMDRLKNAIPWTPADVIKMRNSKNPGQTFTDLAKSKGIGGAQSAAPQGVDPGLWQHMTPQEQSLWK